MTAQHPQTTPSPAAMTRPVPPPLEILARLVAFPTISRRTNLDLLDHIEALFAGSGARMHRFAHEDGSRANLWISIGPDIAGGVVLSGHSDVVPVEGQDWSSDSFALRIADGRAYGRGTADMKGFLACAIHAGLQATGRKLARPLHLAISYDEEIGCLGVRGMIEALAARPSRPALCIIGEPTGMKIASGHKGKAGFRACCHGREGHSALAPRALNALHLGARFVQALEQRQEALAATGPRDDDYDIPYSTIHAGVMRGGTALNIVPNLCEVDFEIRNIAEDDPETILAGIRADAETIAAPYRATFPEARITIDPVTAYPGLATPEDGAALALLRRITGRNDPAIKVAFGTEGGLFAQGLGISTAICGPGFMDQGHRPDEFVALDQLAECSRVLDNLLAILAEA
ncbi:acetylornithine deacetylase [Paracoccus cavernae]|uniref:acetylornithine deacetylase n=1 Tax=Paracoccus cavernae TaxID=1571207 RepID=UPI0035F25BCC